MLTNMNFLDFNSKIGDVQLMELASWLTHEEIRVEEVKKVMCNDAHEPLYIIAEMICPKVSIKNHNIIFTDTQLAPHYRKTQEKTILHFEGTFRLLGNKRFQNFQRRWHAIPLNLQIKEYHSPKRLMNALERTSLYKRIIQMLKINWIGLKLSPLMLLGIEERGDQVEEQKEWPTGGVNPGFDP